MAQRGSTLTVVAVGFAIAAFAVALITVVIVTQRGGRATVQEIETYRVAAGDVAKLQDLTEIVDRGARVTDGDLARGLSLTRDDVITAISGRAIGRPQDLRTIVFNASLLNATTLYVELERGGVAELVRWQLDGDLYQARIAREAIFR